jgi:hypothetical protein
MLAYANRLFEGGMCKKGGGLRGNRFWYVYGFVNACSCFAFIGSAHSEENMHWYKRWA